MNEQRGTPIEVRLITAEEFPYELFTEEHKLSFICDALDWWVFEKCIENKLFMSSDCRNKVVHKLSLSLADTEMDIEESGGPEWYGYIPLLCNCDKYGNEYFIAYNGNKRVYGPGQFNVEWSHDGVAKWIANVEDETTALQLYNDLVLHRHLVELDDFNVDNFHSFCESISRREKMEDGQLREKVLHWIMDDSYAKRQYLRENDRYKLVEALFELVPT